MREIDDLRTRNG